MRRNVRIMIASAAIFVAAEAALGLGLQLASGRAVALLSYAAVVLACLFCVLFWDNTPRYYLTQLALLCTVCADYFLVYLPVQQRLLAMFFFSVAQLSYFGRIWMEDRSPLRRRVHIAVRCGLSLFALILTLLVLRDKADMLSLVSMFYYANLLLNIVFAFLGGRGLRLMAAGLVLFALCDTVIGLIALKAYIPISPEAFLYRLLYPGFNLAWVFYVPSQTLLALSLWAKKDA